MKDREISPRAIPHYLSISPPKFVSFSLSRSPLFLISKRREENDRATVKLQPTAREEKKAGKEKQTEKKRNNFKPRRFRLSRFLPFGRETVLCR